MTLVLVLSEDVNAAPDTPTAAAAAVARVPSVAAIQDASRYGSQKFASVTLERTTPFAGGDLEVLVRAIGEMFEPVSEIVQDGVQPGWTVPFTLEKSAQLGWLGQFVGVRRLPAQSDAEFREAIGVIAGFSRGTPAALKASARRTLTGSQTLIFRERDGDPYHATVITRTSETPDPSATEAAVMAHKPAGLRFTFMVADGQDYAQLLDDNADYAAVSARFVDYEALQNNPPEE